MNGGRSKDRSMGRFRGEVRPAVQDKAVDLQYASKPLSQSKIWIQKTLFMTSCIEHLVLIMYIFFSWLQFKINHVKSSNDCALDLGPVDMIGNKCLFFHRIVRWLIF
jgi:hypothetical protein